MKIHPALEKTALPDGERITWRREPRSRKEWLLGTIPLLAPWALLLGVGLKVLSALPDEFDHGLEPTVVVWGMILLAAGILIAVLAMTAGRFFLLHVASAARGVVRTGDEVRVEYELGPFRWREERSLRSIRAVGYAELAGYPAQLVLVGENRRNLIVSGRIPEGAVVALMSTLEEWARAQGAQIDARLQAFLRLEPPPPGDPGPPPEGRLRLCRTSEERMLRISGPGWRRYELAFTDGAIRMRTKAPLGSSSEAVLHYESPPSPRAVGLRERLHIELTGDLAGRLKLPTGLGLDETAWLWSFLHHLPRPASRGERSLPPAPERRLEILGDGILHIHWEGIRNSGLLLGLFFLTLLVALVLILSLTSAGDHFRLLSIESAIFAGGCWMVYVFLRDGWRMAFSSWTLEAGERREVRRSTRLLPDAAWSIAAPLEIDERVQLQGTAERSERMLEVRGREGREVRLELDLTEDELVWIKNWILHHLPGSREVGRGAS